ncbi:MAG: response regulator [Yoonia sp.]|uniref:response regulator n=1 Tax=Yoonia sp. TaxID=2212373 RepID=UPI003EFAADDE
MRVLVAEDEVVLANQIKDVLISDGLKVDLALDGEQALRLAESEPYDMMILDLGLPKRDGLSVLKRMRASGVETPVLILTARNDWTDRVDGLDAGADDYVAKPFYMAELSARVRALIRRKVGQSKPVFRKGDVSFDSRTSQVLLEGEPVDLTAQEIAVLSYLFHNIGRMISREELAQHIYERDADRGSNTIAVFVNRLRKKLGKNVISTVRGRGYVIKDQA